MECFIASSSPIYFSLLASDWRTIFPKLTRQARLGKGTDEHCLHACHPSVHELNVIILIFLSFLITPHNFTYPDSPIWINFFSLSKFNLMSSKRSPQQYVEAMPVLKTLRRVKRLRLFEPSVGVGVVFLVSTFVICSFFYLDYRELAEKFGFSGQPPERFTWSQEKRGSVEKRVHRVEFLGEKGGGECDLFEGNWVWDESYPLYQSKDCSFLDGGFRCSENGRPDLFYTKWRWQPKACNLPRYTYVMMFYFVIIFGTFALKKLN